MESEYASGWYVDPSDSTRVRYWDGGRWTKDVWERVGAEAFITRGPGPRFTFDLDDSPVDDDLPELPRGGRHAAREHRWTHRILGLALVVGTVVTAWVTVRYAFV